MPASAAELGGEGRGDGSPACRGLAWGTAERGGPGQGSQERQVRGGPEKGKRERKRVGTWEKKRKKGWEEGFCQDQRISWNELARPRKENPTLPLREEMRNPDEWHPCPKTLIFRLHS